MGGGAKRRTAEEMAIVPMWADAVLGTASGLFAAACAAPFIKCVDQAVTENSAGKSPLGRALVRGLVEVFTKPHVMLSKLPFWMVAGVYGSTYTAANVIDVVHERWLDKERPHADRIAAGTKLFGVTAVNMATGVAKDAAFARMFGANAEKPPPVPRISLGLFAFRDVVTIAAGFTLPPILADYLSKSGAVEEKNAGKVAQLMSPIGMQLILTPIHLLALNMYNMPGVQSSERAKAILGVLPGSVAARMGRFGAAYGIGGLLNNSLAQKARDLAVTHYAPPDTPMAMRKH
jgi:hypothetical protein